jgi:hypothetical protein
MPSPAFAQAPRSDAIRERLAGEYRTLRAQVADAAAAAMDDGSPRDTPYAAPELSGVASVLMALFDGLAIQWLLAPAELPDAGEVVRSLRLLASTVLEAGQSSS